MGDLAGLVTKQDSCNGIRVHELCEGCGSILVDHNGVRWVEDDNKQAGDTAPSTDLSGSGADPKESMSNLPPEK